MAALSFSRRQVSPAFIISNISQKHAVLACITRALSKSMLQLQTQTVPKPRGVFPVLTHQHTNLLGLCLFHSWKRKLKDLNSLNNATLLELATIVFYFNKKKSTSVQDTRVLKRKHWVSSEKHACQRATDCFFCFRRTRVNTFYKKIVLYLRLKVSWRA